MHHHPREVQLPEPRVECRDEDGVQDVGNHGSGRALLISIEATFGGIDLHDDVHVLNIQEEFLLGKSEGAVSRGDLPILQHRSLGVLGVPSSTPSGSQQLTRAGPKPKSGPSGSLIRLEDPDPFEWDPHTRCHHAWSSAPIGRTRAATTHKVHTRGKEGQINS